MMRRRSAFPIRASAPDEAELGEAGGSIAKRSWRDLGRQQNWRAASGSGPGGRRGDRESGGRGQRAQGFPSRRSGSGRGECRLKKSYRPSPITDLGGRDSGAPDPPPFRAPMRNPRGRPLPIGVWAIGKADGQRPAPPYGLGVGSALDKDRHLPICRSSRPNPAKSLESVLGASTLKQGGKARNWFPVFGIAISRLIPICRWRRGNPPTFFAGGRKDEGAITYTGRRAAKVDSLLDEESIRASSPPLSF